MPGMDGFETAALIRQRQAVGAHADHLRHRVRRRGARRPGLRARGRRLHPLAGRAGDPADQGPGLRRPVPHDPAGQAAGRGAGRPGRGAGRARGGRGGQPAARRSCRGQPVARPSSLDLRGDAAATWSGWSSRSWPTSPRSPSPTSRPGVARPRRGPAAADRRLHDRSVGQPTPRRCAAAPPSTASWTTGRAEALERTSPSVHARADGPRRGRSTRVAGPAAARPAAARSAALALARAVRPQLRRRPTWRWPRTSPSRAAHRAGQRPALPTTSRRPTGRRTSSCRCSPTSCATRSPRSATPSRCSG